NSSDVVTIPDDDSLSFGDGTTTNPFSINLWVKFNVVSGNHWILSKRDQSTNVEYQMIRFGPTMSFSSYLFSGGGNTDYIAHTGLNPTTGVWYMMTMVFDGTNVLTYIDGAITGSPDSN